MSKSIIRKAYIKFKGQIKGEDKMRSFAPTLTLPNPAPDKEKLLIAETLKNWISKNFTEIISQVQVNICEQIVEVLDEGLSIQYTRSIENYMLFKAPEVKKNVVDQVPTPTKKSKRQLRAEFFKDLEIDYENLTEQQMDYYKDENL